jgi:DNA-binding beta-propeller fold protein YncE
MALKLSGTIAIPDSVGSSFDHGAFDPKTRRVFVAHTGRDRVEVIDHDTGKHLASLPGFKEAAGVVADDGIVLVTNRGAASMAVVDAQSLQTRAVFKTGPKPNGVAIAARRSFAIAASIGEEAERPKLHVISLDGLQQYAVELPGAPRWCVTDADAKRVFLAIREPSMVWVAQLPELTNVEHWNIRAGGAHGLEIDHQRGRLYVACDDKVLTEVDTSSGQISNEWPIAGPPDVTFVNPATGLVHVAIGRPGLVQSVDPRNGSSVETMTGPGAHTTAIVAPDRLYVFSPSHGAALVFADA